MKMLTFQVYIMIYICDIIIHTTDTWVSLVTNTTPAVLGYYKYNSCCISCCQTLTASLNYLIKHNIKHIIIASDLTYVRAI